MAFSGSTLRLGSSAGGGMEVGLMFVWPADERDER